MALRHDQWIDLKLKCYWDFRGGIASGFLASEYCVCILCVGTSTLARVFPRRGDWALERDAQGCGGVTAPGGV